MGQSHGPKLIAALAIAALFASAGIRTHGLTAPNFGDAGRALTAVAVVVAAYDWFLWRWLPVPGRPPRLRGTWKMQLSPRKGPPNASMNVRTCYLSIRQRASAIDAKLFFADGQSIATTTTLGNDQFGGKLLLLFYDFEPHNPTDAEPRRKGAASLDIARDQLHGKYWNDAMIWGELVSESRTGKLHETYQDAAGGFS